MTSLENILLVFSDASVSEMITRSVLAPQGFNVLTAASIEETLNLISSSPAHLLILGDSLPDGDHLSLAAQVSENQPALPIILFADHQNLPTTRELLGLGVVDWLTPPLSPDDLLAAINRALKRHKSTQQWVQVEARRHTDGLMKRLTELEALANVGRSVTAVLDLDRVLKAVLEAAVALTGAEEGSILLLEEETGELYMRAALNFQEEFVSTFRLATEDTLAGEVLRTGEPVRMDVNAPQKISTSYLVHALVYAPLKAHGQPIGVLGVDNRTSGQDFEEHHVTLLSALADYAAIAIENARLYSHTEVERSKLESILTQIHDGVIVLDSAGRPIMINHAVRSAFELGDADFSELTYDEVFKNEALLKAIQGQSGDPFGTEIEVGNARYFNARVTVIPEVGKVVTLHDISYLKELDRVKSDFVTAVSHDLRSPLTAILGYIELMQRAGETNAQQNAFIERVQTSVHSITALINDLLDLGRIEIGLDDSIQMISLTPILGSCVDDLQPQAAKKNQTLSAGPIEELPDVAANPVRMRQMLDNLVGNAIKYTQPGGQIHVVGKREEDQVILQVEDNGPGIPPQAQVRIFEKFYRAGNVPEEIQGTGLGLAIVKSIVDSHQGRIWVESEVGEGSTFTVVLPVAISTT